MYVCMNYVWRFYFAYRSFFLDIAIVFHFILV